MKPDSTVFTVKTRECAHNACQNPCFNELDKCALHCKKNHYSSDFNSGLLKEFDNLLFFYIVNYYDKNINQGEYKNYVSKSYDADELQKLYGSRVLKLFEIEFPDRKLRGNFDFLKLLNRFKYIHFRYCSFSSISLSSLQFEVFYQDCIFRSMWHVTESKVLKNEDKVAYQNCKFLRNVILSKLDDRDRYISINLFNECVFEHNIEISDAFFKGMLFIGDQKFNNNLKIEINKSIFESKILLNKITNKNTSIYFYDSEIQKLECKSNSFDEVVIENCNFTKVVDFYSTSANSIIFEKCIFKDFLGFENCNFGSDKEIISKLKYVTLLGFVNFRDAIFKNGIDLKYSNFKENPNFLGIKVNENLTNRETFRIIKNSFEISGNKIEANKFYAREMIKYKEELESKSINQEKIVFYLNSFISGYGQNFLRPLGILLFTIILYSLIVCGHEGGYLYVWKPEYNPIKEDISNLLNSIASNVPPYNKFLKEGMELISLLYYLTVTILVWHIITSLKRISAR